VKNAPHLIVDWKQKEKKDWGPGIIFNSIPEVAYFLHLGSTS
jgi:hypothetical protein